MTENGQPATPAAATPAAGTVSTPAAEKPYRSSLKGTGAKRFSNVFAVPIARPVMRYMPTYRLEPKLPLNTETCEKVLKNVMDKTFDEYHYSSKNTMNICAHVSEEIKNRIKSLNFDRYRYICVVTIGEKCMQGLNCLMNFLWDPTKDGYIKYVYDTPDYFAIATLYYLYYD